VPLNHDFCPHCGSSWTDSCSGQESFSDLQHLAERKDLTCSPWKYSPTEAIANVMNGTWHLAFAASPCLKETCCVASHAVGRPTLLRHPSSGAGMFKPRSVVRSRGSRYISALLLWLCFSGLPDVNRIRSSNKSTVSDMRLIAEQLNRLQNRLETESATLQR
jgi:hypothetical protein